MHVRHVCSELSNCAVDADDPFTHLKRDGLLHSNELAIGVAGNLCEKLSFRIVKLNACQDFLGNLEDIVHIDNNRGNQVTLNRYCLLLIVFLPQTWCSLVEGGGDAEVLDDVVFHAEVEFGHKQAQVLVVGKVLDVLNSWPIFRLLYVNWRFFTDEN